MSKKDKKCPYEKITGKIENIDLHLTKVTECIKKIKQIVIDDESKLEETCPDLEESEKSLQEVLTNFMATQLLNEKPVGEA
jgi:hypothetical protein